MSELFVSYSRDDHEAIAMLVAKLEAVGWSVAWDLTLPGGSRWAEELERRIRAARAVIVAWSATAVVSRWVREEAETALALERALVPITIDGTAPPMGYRTIHARPLEAFFAHGESGPLDGLIDDLRDLVGAPKLADGKVTARTATRRRIARNVRLWVRIDSTPLLGDAGSEWEVGYSPDMPVHEFLDDVYFGLRPHVPPYTYGKRWLLRDTTTRRCVTGVGEDPRDPRKAALVGLSGATSYEVVAP